MSISLVSKTLIAAIAATAALAAAAAAPTASHRSASASPAVVCAQDTHWSPAFQACVAD